MITEKEALSIITEAQPENEAVRVTYYPEAYIFEMLPKDRKSGEVFFDPHWAVMKDNGDIVHVLPSTDIDNFIVADYKILVPEEGSNE